MFGEAPKRISGDIRQSGLLASSPVCGSTDKGPEDHRGTKPGDEEAADGASVEAVMLIEGVDVGALEPVAG